MLEEKRGEYKIGIIGWGIGFIYVDKLECMGIWVVDLMNFEIFWKKLFWIVEYKNVVLDKFYDLFFLDLEMVIVEYIIYVDCLWFYVVDSFLKIYDVIY